MNGTMRPFTTYQLTANMMWLTDEIRSLIHLHSSGDSSLEVNERASRCFKVLKDSLTAAESNPVEMIPSEIWGPDDSHIENFRITCREGATALSSLPGLSDELLNTLSAFLNADYRFCRGKYRISRDMFTSRIPEWTLHLAEFIDKPISVLEVGCADGLATCWLLDHILTHDQAHIVCIDLPHPEHDLLFEENIKKSGMEAKVGKLRGRSEDLLGTVPETSFDIVYVDASHHQVDVLSDSVRAWRALKSGGLMIMDDYKLKEFFRAKYIFPERPDIAIDAFLLAFAPELEILAKTNQVFVRKVPRASVWADLR